MIHRDLKPGNILLQVADSPHSAIRNPQPAIPKVTDFGLAKRVTGDSSLTQSGQILGTPSFMPPEQAAAKLDLVGVTSDVYALGAILYNLLTGRPPFQAANAVETLRQVVEADPVPPRQLNFDIPRDLETIALKCLEKTPKRRYLSAQLLSEELRRYLDGHPILARPVSGPERSWRWAKRNPGIASLSAGMALLLVMIAIGSGVSALMIDVARRQSDNNAQKALESAELERKTREKAEVLSASLTADRGWTSCAQGDVGPGMLWLSRGLKMSPPHAVELRRAICANLGAWYQQLHSLQATFPHHGSLDVAAFSPDGSRVLTGAEDGAVLLWSVESGQEIGAPLRHTGAVVAATFSPDSKLVLTGSTDGDARLWSATTSEPLSSPLPHQGPIHIIAFSPDGRLALTASNEKTVMIWEVKTGRPLGAPMLHQMPVSVVAFSPQGKQIATGSLGFVNLWDAETGQLIHTFSAAPEPDVILATIVSPDGKTLLAAQEKRSHALLWDIESGRRLHSNSFAHDGPVNCVAFSPNGKLIVTASADTKVRLWDPETGNAVGDPLSHPRPAIAVQFSPDGRTFFTTSVNQAWLWDTAALTTIGVPLCHPVEWLGKTAHAAVRYGPDGTTVATVCADGVRVWKLRGERGLEKVLVHQHQVNHVEFSPDGRTAMTVCSDDYARLWDTQSWLETNRFGGGDGYYGGAFRSDGLVLCANTKLWDIATRKQIGVALATVNPKVAFSPDGRIVATSSYARAAVQLWDAATGIPLCAPRPVDRAQDVAFSPDGRTIVSASDDKTARLWRVPTGEPLDPPLVHQSSVKTFGTYRLANRSVHRFAIKAEC